MLRRVRNHYHDEGVPRPAADFRIRPYDAWTLSGITLPWEVPDDAIVVEFFEGRWRVVSRGRVTELFRDRETALARAKCIAGRFDRTLTIIERTPERESASIAS
jgi:hypothetical protein